MLANDPLSSRLERVNEQNAQQNISVQHICPPNKIREHVSEQPIDNAHLHYVCSGTTQHMWMTLHHYHIRPSILHNAR